ILTENQFAHPDQDKYQRWQSAFTLKMVGALDGITKHEPHKIKALLLGITIGLLIEAARKTLKSRKRYQVFATGSPKGRVTDFTLDAFLLPSPYAFAFGGFVDFITVAWWAAGGVCAALFEAIRAKLISRRAAEAE